MALHFCHPFSIAFQFYLTMAILIIFDRHFLLCYSLYCSAYMMMMITYDGLYGPVLFYLLGYFTFMCSISGGDLRIFGSGFDFSDMY